MIRRKYLSLIETLFCGWLIILSFTVTNFAQDIVIQETQDDPNWNKVCGYIQNEQLNIPSYKFKVTDKNGIVIKNLRTEGELVIEESVWEQNGFFDMDPYWKTEFHNIKIPIIYNSEEDLYVTQAIPKVNLIKRKKGRIWLRKCLDRVTKLRFSFYQNDCDSTMFVFFFPNQTVDKINLPNAEKNYDLGIKTGYSCIK